MSSDVYSRPNVSKVVGFREERPRVGLRKSGDPEAKDDGEGDSSGRTDRRTRQMA